MTNTEMAELGLNVFQVIQNELISREGSRSSLGLGFRLSVLEERMINMEAINRNGKVWRLHHHVSPITALTPEARERVEKRKQQLLDRKGAKKASDDKDPTMHTRKDERWEIHTAFPRTLLDFKELQYHPDKVRSLLEFYDVRVYRPDLKPLDVDQDDHCRDVITNMETCLEELAMHWGINWQRIDGLSLPYPPTPVSSQYGTPSFYSTPSVHTPASSQYSSSPGGRHGSVPLSSAQQRYSPPPHQQQQQQQQRHQQHPNPPSSIPPVAPSVSQFTPPVQHQRPLPPG